MAKAGYHFLRIEIKLYDHKSFRNNGLEHIETLSDLYMNWENLYEFWTCQINKIMLFRPIEISSEMNEQEYLLANLLNSDGFTSKYGENIHTLLSHCKSKSHKGQLSKKSKMHNKIISLINKYGKVGEYGNNQLRVDVALNIIRINKTKREILDVPFLIRNLWNANANSRAV